MPATTPSNIRRRLERCLVKNPKERLRDVGDARMELIDALSRTVVAQPRAVRTSSRAIVAASLGALVIFAAGAGLSRLLPSAQDGAAGVATTRRSWWPSVDSPFRRSARQAGRWSRLAPSCAAHGRPSCPTDPQSLAPRGTARTLGSAERGMHSGGMAFAASRSGMLVFAETGDDHQLVWVSRDGSVSPLSVERAAYQQPRLSPDGRTVIVSANDQTRRPNLWQIDVERGTRTRLRDGR